MSETISLDHPEMGRLRLYREKLAVGTTGPVLVVYHAEPGSDDAERLALLASYGIA